MFNGASELCDVVSHAIFCVDDSTMLLALEGPTNEYWLPSGKVGLPGENSWQSTSNQEMLELFSADVRPDKVLRICKVWVPFGPIPSVYHCVYETKINTAVKRKVKSNIGKYRGKLKWVSEKDLRAMLAEDSLRSPELLDFFQIIKAGGYNANTYLSSEFPMSYPIVELGSDALVDITKPGNHEQVVIAAGFNTQVQTEFLREFIIQCFPALYMSFHIFTRLVLDLGWFREDTQALYKAADWTDRGGLTFRELVFVLAAAEPKIPHGGVSADIRCRYIFRFFDRDRDQFLNINELKSLLLYMKQNKNQNVDIFTIQREAQNLLKQLSPNTKNQGVSLHDLTKLVAEMKLRGTSLIFRSHIGVVEYLQNVQDKDPVDTNIEKAGVELKPTMGSKKSGRKDFEGDDKIVSPAYRKSEKYELCMHCVRLQDIGQSITVDEVENLETGMSQSSTKQQTLGEYCRRLSLDRFNEKSNCNEVLKIVRALMRLNGHKPEIGRWGNIEINLFTRYFVKVCEQAKALFKSEARMLDIKSPVYIMGDFHGNMADLFYFEKVFWHLGPSLCPCNLLFLGDYVDRGPFSLEVIAYLLCYKVQNPTKVSLLRGNHEVRNVQKLFTFPGECRTKLGDKLGDEIWNTVNDVFDVMPLAAVIDGRVFCCHGGIPPPWLCPAVSAINAIPLPLPDPSNDCHLAWNLMWNDPVKPVQMTKTLAMELAANEGFAVNMRRGTANIFTAEALDKFLTLNGFSHLIRAHECRQCGFQLQQKAHVLTVFSCSKYGGGTNEAACILADQGKLRALRLEVI